MGLSDILSRIPAIGAPGPLLLFALLLVWGGAGGWLATRAHLPSVIGNLVAGALLGPYVLRIVPNQRAVESMAPLSMFAIGLIMITIGGHLSWRRIHNSWRRIAWIAIFEFAVTVCVVAFGAHALLGFRWPVALLLAGLAGDTSPATIIHVCRESKAKGPFVKTLLSVVALDNIFTITVFVVLLTSVADYFASGLTRIDLARAWIHPAWIVLGSAATALVCARTCEFLIERFGFHDFATLFVAILMATGLASWLAMSPLLTGLIFGICLGNSTSRAERLIHVLDPFEWILYSAFFTLAGVGLHVDRLIQVGLFGLGFVLLRAAGKMLGAGLGGIVSGSSRRIWQNIPLGLLPQSSVAIALTIRLQSDMRVPLDIRETIIAMVLAGVVVNEFLGPLATRFALKRAGETGKDRPRLVEFLEEEFIKTDLTAGDKWDAMRQLADFLIRTHRVEHVSPDALYQSIVEREKSDSTAIGRGAAIPHGIIDEGPQIQGVLGICPAGVDFGAPDGVPVRIIMLIVTPKNQQSQHLKILSALAAMIRHPAIRSRLVNAPDANAVWEVIEGEETPDFNSFLED